jgi:hypothetical protein
MFQTVYCRLLRVFKSGLRRPSVGLKTPAFIQRRQV